MKTMIFALITVMAILLGIMCPIGAGVFAETESVTAGNFIGTETTSETEDSTETETTVETEETSETEDLTETEVTAETEETSETEDSTETEATAETEETSETTTTPEETTTATTTRQTIDDDDRRLSNFVIDDVNFDGIVDNNDVTIMKKLVLSGQENVRALAKLKMDILHADECFPKQVTSIQLKKFDVNLFNVTYLSELCRTCSYAELINDVLYTSVHGDVYTINIKDTIIKDDIYDEMGGLDNYWAKYYKIAEMTTEKPRYVVTFWYGGVLTEEPTYRVSVRPVDGKI